MSEISGHQIGDVALLGQIAQEVGDYFVRIGRYEEAIEECEDTIIAYDRFTEGLSKTDETRKLRASAWNRLNELKYILFQQPFDRKSSDVAKKFNELFELLDEVIVKPPFVSVTVTHTLLKNISEIRELLKDIFVSSAIQLPIPMKGDKEQKELLFPRLIQTQGYRKDGYIVLLDEDSKNNSDELKKVIQGIKKREKVYSQLLAQSYDGIWSICEENPDVKIPDVKIPDVKIPDVKILFKIKDIQSDMFILIVDAQDKRMLQKSTKRILEMLDGEDTPEKKVSANTFIIIIEIEKTGENK